MVVETGWGVGVGVGGGGGIREEGPEECRAEYGNQVVHSRVVSRCTHSSLLPTLFFLFQELAQVSVVGGLLFITGCRFLKNCLGDTSHCTWETNM